MLWGSVVWTIISLPRAQSPMPSAWRGLSDAVSLPNPPRRHCDHRARLRLYAGNPRRHAGARHAEPAARAACCPVRCFSSRMTACKRWRYDLSRQRRPTFQKARCGARAVDPGDAHDELAGRSGYAAAQRADELLFMPQRSRGALLRAVEQRGSFHDERDAWTEHRHQSLVRPCGRGRRLRL